jgi:hypothetical protein
MAVTEAGKAFVERMSVVNQMIQGGAPVFPALASGLEDNDWLLVYAAIARMVQDIERSSESDPPPTRSDAAE